MVEEAKENDFKKDMTTDEKKAQRAAKAAEKKARAEAAAAKKAAQKEEEAKVKKTAGRPTTEGAGAEAKKKTQQQQKAVKVVEKENDEICKKFSVIKFTSPPPPATKSVLKTQPTGRGSDQEVKFDLTVYASDQKKTSSQETKEDLYDPLTSQPRDVHPAFLNLVKLCENELCRNVDELGREFLKACRTMFTDFYTNKFLVARKYDKAEQLLAHQIVFLTDNDKWSLPPALGNIFRLIRRQLQKIDENLSQEDSLELVTDELDSLETSHFVNSTVEIASHLEKKLVKITEIIVYGGNRIIEEIAGVLIQKRIVVTVVDDEWSLSRKVESPAFLLAKTLVNKGCVVNYCDMKGVARVMPTAQMAVLSSSAVFLHGGVSCPKGSAQFCYVARAFNIPVVICAQTFKFVDMVHHPGRTSLLRRQNDEIVPPDLVTALITEMRLLPASSAPAVVKSKMGV